MSTPLLEQRYGLPGRMRRRVTVAAVTVVAIAAIAWLAWAALAQSRNGAVSGSEVALRVIDDRHTDLDIDVRAPVGTSVKCTAAAYGAGGAVVGTAEVSRTIAGGSARITMSIVSVTRATSAKLAGCTRASKP